MTCETIATIRWLKLRKETDSINSKSVFDPIYISRLTSIYTIICTLVLGLLKRLTHDIDILGFEQETNNRKKITELGKEQKYREVSDFLSVLVESIKAIDPTAKMHCKILRKRPVKVPGVPGKFCCIFHSNTTADIRN